jgi:hypothetical protein
MYQTAASSFELTEQSADTEEEFNYNVIYDLFMIWL